MRGTTPNRQLSDSPCMRSLNLRFMVAKDQKAFEKEMWNVVTLNRTEVAVRCLMGYFERGGFCWRRQPLWSYLQAVYF